MDKFQLTDVGRVRRLFCSYLAAASASATFANKTSFNGYTSLGEWLLVGDAFPKINLVLASIRERGSHLPQALAARDELSCSAQYSPRRSPNHEAFQINWLDTM
jgi:hypothetical protein